MTFAYGTKREATRAARVCLHMLRSPTNWKVSVFENIGWHWVVSCKTLSLRKGSHGFYAMMNDGKHGMDCTHANSEWMIADCFDDPNKAVDAQLRFVLKKLTDTLELVTDIATIVGSKVSPEKTKQ